MRIRRFFTLIIVAVIAVVCLVLVFRFSGSSSAGGESGAVKLRLNEVMTSNKGAVPDANGDFPDWIEIYNPTEKDINISGFGLTDDKLVSAKWVFPGGTTIKANGYVVVYCSGEIESGPMHASFKLSGTDEIVFSNAAGRPIDQLALRSVGKNLSLGRDEAGNWVEQAAPSPGYPNTDAGAQAYRDSIQVTVIDNGIRINEFMASNATTLPGLNGDYPDWIELYNTTGAPVDISGCGLSDDVNQPMKWLFPAETVIQPKSVLLILCSGREGLIDGELHAPFGLRAYKEDVVFAGANGAVIDSYSYNNQETDISMARIPDGTGEFQICTQPTPGFLNNEDGFAAHMSTQAFPRGDIQLSEVCNNNNSSLVADDTSPDWIELFNASGTAVNLAGYALSDNSKNPALWVFPDITIEAGTYMTVLATGANVKDTQKKNLETNFGLSAMGDVLFLFSPEGELLDKLQVKNAGPDITYGRINGELRYFDTPTPGAANQNGYAGVTAQPVFTIAPGIYSSAVEVAIEADSGARVCYTLDSSAPTAQSTQYTEPIQVSKNTVIRAVAVRDGYLTGASNTGTYLFTADGANHALPVATLVLDPPDLWDSKRGIYAYGEKYDPDLPYGDALATANFFQGNSIQGEEAQTAWERPASFAIFDEETKQQVFSQNVSTRIAGAFGRGRAQKAFNIIARGEYGSNRLAYAFFDSRPYTEYKSLVLRAGAQDQNRSKIRDELSTGLLEGSDVRFLYQAYKPYVLYLNGEYWGVYFLKEKRSRFFVAQHENITDVDNLDLLKASTRVSHGSNKEWLDLMEYIKSHDLSSAENYAYVEARIDVNSFMDYMICELYTGNSDYANIQYYKLPGGKWKWVYYDFCWGFSNVDHPTITNRRGQTPAASGLFNALLKNPGWRDAFVRRFAEIMNTVFAEDKINALVDELYAYVEPEIKREREKFNGPTFMNVKQHSEVLGSYESFQNNIASIRKFAAQRPAVIKAQLKSELGLSDSYMQEVFG